MKYVFATQRELCAQGRKAFFKYRHKVFINHLGWDLDLTQHCIDQELEIDQFDGDDTLYVISKNTHDEIVGCARLLPTTQPYLLEEVFPELLGSGTAPKANDVWELSRFACIDFNQPVSNGKALNQTQRAITLFLLTVEAAKQHGAKHFVTVSPLGIEKMLKREGFSVSRFAPPKLVSGYALVGCWINLS
ncbi:acyl-homoserine-lactone synthase [Vibrio ouci]|uniref:Acyl-homoserine-lactone synthase n=1 Tax=Vibrio ouci TaxID=2499078 RepID=A0A4Y8WJQ0_9VIBR|nr:acyl-homoserine-lactone synthase [Vibrio ouci]TFH92845.1 GNAT family N-acetyltransferase [Vibrio ouci]